MATFEDDERLQVMTETLRDVWRLALQWQRDDDYEPLAGDVFTAFSPLLAWEEERGVPSTVADLMPRAAGS